MKVTVVTAVLNRARTLAECLASVAAQTHRDVEHVLIDGGSTDGSVELIRAKTVPGHWVSEPDAGLYAAINKGIAAATGDVIGILGADDVYASSDVLERVAAVLSRTGADACHGDLEYVSDADPGRLVRRWIAGPYVRGSMRFGWMPPHPTFFVRREQYQRLGTYDTRLRIAADYELLLRFIQRHRISLEYLPSVLVRMRTGGASNSPRNLARKTLEDWRAWRMNGLSGGTLAVVGKNLRKAPQLLPWR